MVKKIVLSSYFYNFCMLRRVPVIVIAVLMIIQCDAEGSYKNKLNSISNIYQKKLNSTELQFM